MNNRVLMVISVSLSLIFLPLVQASEQEHDLTPLIEQARQQAGILSKQKQYQLTVDKSDFGTYKVESELALVPESLAAIEHRVARIGAMSVVKSAKPDTRVLRGTLVRNVLTNKLAPVSGNITVLLAKDVSADQVAREMGLNVAVSYQNTQLAVLSVPEETDVLLAAKLLKASDLIVQAKVEVQDVAFQAY